METIELNTGAKIPAIGFGTWQIIFGVKKKVLQAINADYRLIDTAKIYGNEVGVGAAIRESGVARDKLFVTTKLWTSDQGYEKAHAGFDESLRRLGLDYVDLYLIHWPGHDADRRKQSWRAMEEIYNGGLAKAIGVSNYKSEHIKELIKYAKVKPAVNQIEFHPYTYEDQLPTLELCKQLNITVEAYSPLAHGRHSKEPVVAQIAAEHKATSAQVMLAWCLHHQTIPLPKTTDEARMKENLGAVDIKLTKDEVELLNKLSRGEHVLPWH